jgi:hypothetical protein
MPFGSALWHWRGQRRDLGNDVNTKLFQGIVTSASGLMEGGCSNLLAKPGLRQPVLPQTAT